MSEGRAAPPVTVLVTRRVRRGRAREFERLMAGMQAAAAIFPGHMGGFLIPPEQAEQGCYRVLFAFDTDAHLQAWTQRRERQRWHRRIADVTHGDAATRVLSGLETWFALPAARTNTIAPVLGSLIHPLLVSLVATGLITAAMTWLVMPALVPLFSHWLYPDAARTDALASPTPEKQ